MRLVAHLVRADLRRFTPALSLWCAIVAAAALLHGVQPYAVGGRPADLIVFLAVVTWIGGLLVMLGLIAQVVQADPVAGTNAFWLTRPIPPLSLLGAKVTVIAMAMVLIPTVVEAVLMAAHGVAPATIATVAIQAIVVQSFWVLIAMSYATLTPGVAQFFLLCGATPLALVLGLLVLDFAVRAEWLDRHWVSLSAFENTRAGIVFVVLTIAGAIGLLLISYRTRSRRHAIAVGLALIFVVLLVPELVPASTGSPVSGLPRWTKDIGPLSVDALSFRVERDFRSDGPVLQGRVLIGDLPDNWSATIAVTEPSLMSDHSSVKSDFGFASSGSLDAPAVWENGARDPSTVAALKSVLGVQFVRGLPPGGIAPAKLFATSSRAVDRLGPIESMRYRGTLTLSFVERAIAGVLRPGRGDSLNDGHRRLTILAMHAPQGDDRGTRVTVRESVGRTIFDSESARGFEMYLRNSQRNEAVFGSLPWELYRGPEFSSSMLMPVPIESLDSPLGFRIATTPYRFPPLTADRSVHLDESWLAGADLVIVAVRQAGSINRVLEIPAVPVPARRDTP